MKFKDRVIKFFYGRYGTDQLNTAFLILCMILLFIALFLQGVPKYVLWGVTLALMILSTVRMMSKNIGKRRRENEVFLKIVLPVRSFFIRQFNRIRYIKKYRYRKCPGCKNHLRLPYSKGRHEVKCPRCGKLFSVKL